MGTNEMQDWLFTIFWVVTIFFVVAIGYMLTIGWKPRPKGWRKTVFLVLLFGYVVFIMGTMIIVLWLSSRQNSEGDKKLEPKSINQIEE